MDVSTHELGSQERIRSEPLRAHRQPLYHSNSD